jgi:hypothetical protein
MREPVWMKRKRSTWSRSSLMDEIDDVLGGSAGEEDLRNAGGFEGSDVRFWDDAADEDGDVIHTFFAEELHELGANGVVSAGENGKPDNVDVFLYSGRGDHFGSLTEAGVNDFHARVAEGSGDDLGAAVVAVETGLGDEYADLFCEHVVV